MDRWKELVKQLKEQPNVQFTTVHTTLESSPLISTPDIKIWWDTLTVLTVLYWVALVPVELVTTSLFPPPPARMVVEGVLTLFSVADLLVYLNGGPTPRIMMELPRQKLRMRYLRSMFVVDLLSTVPFDVIGIATDNRTVYLALRGLRILQLAKMKRVFNLVSFMSPRYASFMFRVVPIFRLGFWAFLLVHYLSVGWILVNPSDFDDGDTKYNRALYFIAYTLSSVGYGDVVVSHGFPRWYATGVMWTGLLLQGVTIGEVTAVMLKSSFRENTGDKMRATLAMLKHFNIPPYLQRNILSFQMHNLEHNISNDYSSIIDGLPRSMQEHIKLYVRIKYISMVPMFQQATFEARANLAKNLQHVFCNPGDFIVHQGEIGSEMFFLGHGLAEVLNSEGKQVTVLKKGNFFGEIALLLRCPRTATVKALSYCDMFRLDRKDFIAIVEDNEAFKQQVLATITVRYPEQADSIRSQFAERVRRSSVAQRAVKKMWTALEKRKTAIRDNALEMASAWTGDDDEGDKPLKRGTSMVSFGNKITTANSADSFSDSSEGFDDSGFLAETNSEDSGSSSPRRTAKDALLSGFSAGSSPWDVSHINEPVPQSDSDEFRMMVSGVSRVRSRSQRSDVSGTSLKDSVVIPNAAWAESKKNQALLVARIQQLETCIGSLIKHLQLEETVKREAQKKRKSVVVLDNGEQVRVQPDTNNNDSVIQHAASSSSTADFSDRTNSLLNSSLSGTHSDPPTPARQRALHIQTSLADSLPSLPQDNLIQTPTPQATDEDFVDEMLDGLTQSPSFMDGATRKLGAQQRRPSTNGGVANGSPARSANGDGPDPHTPKSGNGGKKPTVLVSPPSMHFVAPSSPGRTHRPDPEDFAVASYSPQTSDTQESETVPLIGTMSAAPSLTTQDESSSSQTEHPLPTAPPPVAPTEDEGPPPTSPTFSQRAEASGNNVINVHTTVYINSTNGFNAGSSVPTTPVISPTAVISDFIPPHQGDATMTTNT
eukprot:TRINITY_DN20671_c0_g1_i1.p1 TRINITY_DN20671_c0_g1~~TRINITY_DN20671_c0_g1_i1.p1  ORF type:complete len:996 (-),score=91.27 TRINITY_DN20671_c0_g1_i1:180-3167(-)